MRRLCGGLDSGFVGHLHNGGVHPGRGTEFFLGAVERGRVVVPQAAIRAGGEQALRDGEADAARRAGDDGGLPVQIDLVHSRWVRYPEVYPPTAAPKATRACFGLVGW